MSSLLSVLLTIGIIGVFLIAVFLLVALKTSSAAGAVSFKEAQRLAVMHLQEALPNLRCGDALPTGWQDTEDWLVEVPLAGADPRRFLVNRKSGRVTAVGRSQLNKVAGMKPYREDS